MVICSRNIFVLFNNIHLGLIGKDNKLPWSYPDEFQHFVDTTRGHVIIMGRKSFEDTPQFVLDQTIPIVFTRSTDFVNTHQKCNFVQTIEDLLEFMVPTDVNVYFIGGGELYELFFANNLIQEFVLTIITKEFVGDKYIKLEYMKDWSRNELKRTDDYTIYKLKKL